MHLSRLVLNPDDPRVRKDLASLYELHRTLANVFPGKRAENEGPNESRALLHGLLFRLEPPSASSPVVLVQSVTVPDWSVLPRSYVLRVNGPKEVRLALREGQHLRFRLVANPVRRVRVAGKENRRRLPLVFDRHPEKDGYLDWLGRQAKEAGFVVLDVEDAPFRLAPKQHLGRQVSKSRLPHFGVRFEGVLRVTAPAKLVEAVRRGIGPAKAFGFGLLSLAPAG
jgi:CRISPR system Cascade subunit CasE